MLPAPPNFHTTQLPHFALQSYGPHIPPTYIPHPHTRLQDPLHAGADPNSPEAFKENIRAAHARVLELQAYAKKLLSSIRQNAYQLGNSPAQTEADIANLRQSLAMVIETLRQSGVGALPVVPLPTHSISGISGTSTITHTPVPNEKTLLESVPLHIRVNHDKLQRSQDSSAVVANLLTTDLGGANVNANASANANARAGAK